MSTEKIHCSQQVQPGEGRGASCPSTAVGCAAAEAVEVDEGMPRGAGRDQRRQSDV